MEEITKKQNEINVETITKSLMEFAIDFTEELRTFCTQNPKKPPETIAGTMDHTTILSFTCGTISRILKMLRVARHELVQIY